MYIVHVMKKDIIIVYVTILLLIISVCIHRGETIYKGTIIRLLGDFSDRARVPAADE